MTKQEKVDAVIRKQFVNIPEENLKRIVEKFTADLSESSVDELYEKLIEGAE